MTTTITAADAAAGSQVERARAIVRGEMLGLEALANAVDGSVVAAVELVGRHTGRLVVTGVGKSGLIGRKLAATFASTGTPSFFLHAAEAAHGDLGMIARGDVVLAISNSGNSRELVPVLDYCAANGVPVIGVCARRDSRLAKGSDVLLLLPDVVEVCPNNLAPTTSATVTLVLGHVLAVLLMEQRSFREADFANFHPGGRLGLMLQTVQRYVDEFGGEVPTVAAADPIETVISCMASGRKGCVVVSDPTHGTLHGIITEGDLRRAYAPDMFGMTAGDIMTRTPTTVTPLHMMREAVALMKERRIANLLVVEDGKVLDVLHIKDLMQRGYL